MALSPAKVGSVIFITDPVIEILPGVRQLWFVGDEIIHPSRPLLRNFRLKCLFVSEKQNRKWCDQKSVFKFNLVLILNFHSPFQHEVGNSVPVTNQKLSTTIKCHQIQLETSQRWGYLNHDIRKMAKWQPLSVGDI